MKTIQYSLAQGIAHVVFNQPDSPVNTMCLEWQSDMHSLAEQIVKDKAQIKGVILSSAKTTFFAGADLKAFMRTEQTDGPAFFQQIEKLKHSFRTIETLGVPVVSCINGSAMGGGWEVALIGHHRIALKHAKTQLGLPEVSLGLIPGASGITKMVRLLGLMGAQPFLLEGQLFNPQKALELGLIHEIVDTPEQLLSQALAFIQTHPVASHPWDQKDYKIPGGTPSNPKVAMALTVAPAMIKKTSRGLYPAPEAALAAMVEGAQVDFDTALRIESRYLAKLFTHPVAKNMVNTFFFNMNAIKSGQSRPGSAERYQAKKVGILGAGMMGSGIAYSQAAKGISTVLKDVSKEAAEKGKSYSHKLTQARVDKGRMSAAAQEQLLQLIHTTDSYEDLSGCDLIIEAVFENRDLKASVTQASEGQLLSTGFFASNTSTLPISGLAKASTQAEKFIGIHFFSPVDKMKLVEIIRGKATSDETVAKAFDYVQQLGKIPIVVNDSRGFYTSRTFGTFVMEGAAMLGEGIPAAVIENAAMQVGMPVGPLAVLDETALTLSVHVLDQTRADYALEGKTYIATPGELLVEEMVKKLARHGRAAGAGFYEYPATKGQKKYLWPDLAVHYGKENPQYLLQDVKDRILYRQAIETARCLTENVLTTVHDGNIGSIFGIGFPAWTGGALQFIYSMGIAAFCQRAAELASQFGPGFEVTQEVKDCLIQHQPVY